MARRSPTHMTRTTRTHQATGSVRQRDSAPPTQHAEAVQSDTQARAGVGLVDIFEMAAHEILAVTYWFEPVSRPESYPLTIRFSGRRVGVEGRLQSGDEFVHNELVEEVVPGSGPLSVTVQIRHINPGEWAVTARELSAPHAASRASRRWAQKQAAQVAPVAAPQGSVARLWRRWVPSVEAADSAEVAGLAESPGHGHMHTSLLLFARAPGIIPGIWLVLVALGMAIALAVQSWVIARALLAVGPALPATVIAIAVGILVAKVWYLIVYRHESGLKRWNGWCIQGFITGATVMAAIMLVVLRMPAGTFLDVTAPGMLLGMGIGRIGCFFAGCCGGPLTASRWGVWSCDRHIGGRRIPTQLMESALALSLGIMALGAVLSHGPADGAFFVAALAAYTLGRQGILYLRAEPRKTRLGLPATAALAALVLVAAIVFFLVQ